MATNHEAVRTKQRVTARRARSGRPATDRLRKQSRKVTKDLQEMVGAAKDAAQEKLGELRENASEYYEQGRGKVQHVDRTLEQFIRARPFPSVLIAAGVGLLLGRFWLRR